jgi:hypothetical protein
MRTFLPDKSCPAAATSAAVLEAPKGELRGFWSTERSDDMLGSEEEI